MIRELIVLLAAVASTLAVGGLLIVWLVPMPEDAQRIVGLAAIGALVAAAMAIMVLGLPDKSDKSLRR